MKVWAVFRDKNYQGWEFIAAYTTPDLAGHVRDLLAEHTYSPFEVRELDVQAWPTVAEEEAARG